MMPLTVAGVGVCAGGLPDWERASRVLCGAAALVAGPPPKGMLEGLPPTERRRINETSRLACLAAGDALARLPPGDATTMRTVFTSSDGDGIVLVQMLDALAQRNVVMSPTAFHNSVYNAPAGYWSILTRSNAPSTTVCAGKASFAVGLLEGYAQVQATGGPVLVVAVDAPFPEPIRALGESASAFACALVLNGANDKAHGPRIDGWSIGDGTAKTREADEIIAAFAGNAAAAGLPLLRALARRDPSRVALPYLDNSWLELEVVP